LGSAIGDVAEYMPFADDPAPGDIVALDLQNSGTCRRATEDLADLVIGVLSTNPSVLINSPATGKPVALVGRVLVNVDASQRPIRPGDSITPGQVPGVGVRAVSEGRVVGIALEALDHGLGQIQIILQPGRLFVGHGGKSSETAQATEAATRAPSLAPSRVTVGQNGPPPIFGEHLNVIRKK
jgi:hypothetical protein